MKITPLDIQQAGFKVRMRGYDRQEVDSFLDAITEDYEALVRENNAEEMKHVAQKDADLVMKEAELKAEEMIHTAREEMAAIKREILDLQKQRVVFLEKVRSMIKIFQRVVELEDREEEKTGKKDRSEEERDDNVRLLKPKT
ncbi:MAG: DivIVA domain-containing protein [Nitrospirae bacterium]|nr:DivIVA domain-containing protein [Nitrospirota bacterium]